ncbi:MAG: cell division protein FtsH, partial [Bartonella sp.]|nr:cell division protein FtsH [Bartonella sp.]
AMTQEEKELTAYHEAGHAIVALSVPVADPVHKATIVPRGRALGMVMQLPEGDRYSMSYRWMISRLAIMMGGRVAEELRFGKENITSGAASDIEQATKLARAMITRWGFSDILGNVAYGDNQDEVFLGHSVARTQNISEETARMIDAEVRKLIDDAYKSATKILKEKKKKWWAIAQGLLEYETLTGQEINNIIQGKPLVRAQESEDQNPRTSGVPKTGKKGKQNTSNLEKESSNHEGDTSDAEKKSRSTKNKTEANKSDKAETGNIANNKENTTEKSHPSERKKKQTPANDA